MKKVVSLTKAYISLLLKDKMSLFWFLAFPLIFVVLFGFVVPNVGNQNDMIILTDDPDSAVVKQLTTFPRSTIKESSKEAELTSLQDGYISILIEIRGEQIDIHYLSAEENWVNTIRNSIMPYTNSSQIETQSYSGIERIEAVDFILPGMIALTVMQIGLFGGTSLLEDRSKQILRRLKISGIKSWQVILSHILSRLCVVILAAIVLVLFGLILQVPLNFEYWHTQLFFIILGGFAFLSIGLLIASILRTPESGNILSQSMNFLMAFICGVFLPISIFPDAVQAVVSYLPLTPMAEVLRELFLGSGGFDTAAIMLGSLIILAWGIASFILGSLLFKWE